MKTLLLLLVSAFSLFAAPRSPAVLALNAKQVLFQYSRPDPSTCTWSFSTSAGYSPSVADVIANPTDSASSGMRYYFIGGSTALTASTLYYWQQVCESGAETYTGTITTPAAQPSGTCPWAIGVGMSLGSDSTFWETGTTLALGTTSTAVCVAACTISGTKAADSLLFWRYTAQNAGTSVNSASTIQVMP